MTRESALRRLERANPCPEDPGVAKTGWGRELLSIIVADEGTPTPSHPRRRRLGRRGPVLALAAALVIGAGGALAAIAINQQAPAPTQKAVRQALDLPGPERAALKPLPGGIREVFRAETPYGTWVIDTIQTKGEGVLITGGVLRADGTLKSSGIGGCPASVLRENAVIGWCGGGTYPLGPDNPRPQFDINGRVSPEVASIQLTTSDGRVIPGYIGGGFYLVLFDGAPGGDSHLVARDAAGSVISDQLFRVSKTDPGLPMWVVAPRG